MLHCDQLPVRLMPATVPSMPITSRKSSLASEGEVPRSSGGG